MSGDESLCTVIMLLDSLFAPDVDGFTVTDGLDPLCAPEGICWDTKPGVDVLSADALSGPLLPVVDNRPDRMLARELEEREDPIEPESMFSF